MSDMQIAAVQQTKLSFWWHLGIATVFSLVVPYLGFAYLGLKSPNAQTEWQRRVLPLTVMVIIAMASPFVLNFELAVLLAMTSGWALIVAISIGSLWRVALRKDSLIAIAPGAVGSLLYFLFMIPVVAMPALLRLDWPTVILFRAPQTTPVVAAGDLLYGLKYTPTDDDDRWSRPDHDGRVQRGQLLLARVEGKESLVRVLAVQGDIFATVDDGLLINGSHVSLRSVTEPWDKERLNEFVRDLATARESAGTDALDQLVQNQAQVVAAKRLLVARDIALLKPEFSGAVPVLEISDDDVVLIPWAKFWSIGDHPGAASELAQPTNLFFRG